VVRAFSVRRALFHVKHGERAGSERVEFCGFTV
jgi:hypothetical protein